MTKLKTKKRPSGGVRPRSLNVYYNKEVRYFTIVFSEGQEEVAEVQIGRAHV